MRLLLAARRPAPPFFFGGAEIGNRILGEEARRQGHDVLQLGSFTHPRWKDERLLPTYLRRLGPQLDITRDHEEAVTVMRYATSAGTSIMTTEGAYRAALDTTLSEWRPDLVIATCAGSVEICAAAHAQNVPSIAWVQDAGADGKESAEASATWTAYASRYLLRELPPAFGTGILLHPPFRPAPTTPQPPPPNPTVLLVNPIPEKGSELFLRLAARLPDFRFLGLTGWRTPDWAGKRLTGNVRCLPRQDEPSAAYWVSSVVVVPSTLREGFGRVVVEGALHLRRVLCHAIGALPESSGVAANLLDDLSVDRWEEALRRTHNDRVATESAIREAQSHATRFLRPLLPEIAVATGLDLLGRRTPRE